ECRDALRAVGESKSWFVIFVLEAKGKIPGLQEQFCKIVEPIGVFLQLVRRDRPRTSELPVDVLALDDETVEGELSMSKLVAKRAIGIGKFHRLVDEGRFVRFELYASHCGSN